MPAAERAIQMQRMVQLFQAVSYMREVFKFRGGSRMMLWVAEQAMAKTPADRVAQKMRAKAEELKLTYVLSLINTASSS